MKTVKQVIIFGAGASKSEGTPLQNELFRKFFDYYTKEKQGFSIIQFFHDFWGIDSSNYQNPDIIFPTFEECLGVLDWANSRLENFKGYSSEKINEIRDSLIFLIAKVLDETLNEKTTHHRNLINRLKNQNSLDQTSFISLNYDIIIDKVLTDLCPCSNINYGIEFDNINHPKYENSTTLLKIHGSLNWLYCSTCHNMEITSGDSKAVETFYHKQKCNRCRMPVKPVILPPTFYKEMTNPFIQQIFLKADSLLRYTDKIFICGYSFADADMHIKYLLKRAEIFRCSTPQIHVINYHDGKEKKQIEEEKQRFLRFFRDKDKVFYHEQISFEQFAESGIR